MNMIVSASPVMAFSSTNVDIETLPSTQQVFSGSICNKDQPVNSLGTIKLNNLIIR